MPNAKIIQRGNSQFLLLPNELRLDFDKYTLDRDGEIYILSPTNNQYHASGFSNNPDHSGQLVLHIPRSLHHSLSEHARQENVSLNDYCLYLLSANNTAGFLNTSDVTIINSSVRYRGYVGSVEYSEADDRFYGRIQAIPSSVSFEGKNVTELISDFHRAVDDYLEFCHEEESHPEHSSSTKSSVDSIAGIIEKQFETDSDSLT